MAFAILFLIPALIALVFFLVTKNTITLKEFMLQIAIQVVIAVTSVVMIYHRNTSDTEVWNGTVTGKQQVQVSCSHSYRCFCHQSCSGSGKSRSCHQVCQTCHEHSHDYNWQVDSTIGSLNISRIDRQGVNEPPRFTAVKIGEAYSDTRPFRNYIKAAPDTLFRHQGLMNKFAHVIPQYPNQIYDYYRLDRTVVVNGSLSDTKQWNEDLSKINRDIGKPVGVNMIVVFAFNQPREYFYALQQAWIGGKKNDVILVIGTNSQKQVQWAEVMAWTTNEMFKVKLRDRIQDLKEINRSEIITALKEETQSRFKRRSMEDFAYLESSITPSVTEWMIGLIIGVVAAIIMGIVMHREDIFNEDYRRRGYSRY